MVLGAAQAEPLTLSAEQMDQVTASGNARVSGGDGARSAALVAGSTFSRGPENRLANGLQIFSGGARVATPGVNVAFVPLDLTRDSNRFVANAGQDTVTRDSNRF
jgi:hypothetical protein